MTKYFDEGVFFTRHADSPLVIHIAKELSARFVRAEITEHTSPVSGRSSGERRRCGRRIASMLKSSLRLIRTVDAPWKTRYKAMAECSIAYAALFEALEIWSRFYPGYLDKVLESAEAELRQIVRQQQSEVEGARQKQFLVAFHLGLSHACYYCNSRARLITPESPDILEAQMIEQLPALLRDIANSTEESSLFSASARNLIGYGSALLQVSELFELPGSDHYSERN